MKKLIQFELRKIFSKRLTQIALLFVLFFLPFWGFLAIKINTHLME